jgi:hypothetical protein
VVEGRAVEVSDGAELEQVANTYESKYGERFTAPEGTWFGLSDAIRAGKALVYRVTPTTILGFAKGEQFSQTRWRYPALRPRLIHPIRRGPGRHRRPPWGDLGAHP